MLGEWSSAEHGDGAGGDGDSSPISRSHDALMSKFFSYLLPGELVVASRVCKHWYYLTVGDERMWEDALTRWMHVQPRSSSLASRADASASSAKKSSTAALAAALAVVDNCASGPPAPFFRPINPALKRFAAAWQSRSVPRGKFSLPASTKMLMMLAASATTSTKTEAAPSSTLKPLHGHHHVRAWLSLFYSDSCRLFRGPPLVRHHHDKACIEKLVARAAPSSLAASSPLLPCLKVSGEAEGGGEEGGLSLFAVSHHHHDDGDDHGNSGVPTCEACALKKQVLSTGAVSALHRKIHQQQQQQALESDGGCCRSELVETTTTSTTGGGYLLVKLILQNANIGGSTCGASSGVSAIAVVPSRICARLKPRAMHAGVGSAGSTRGQVIWAHAQRGKRMVAALNGKELPDTTDGSDIDIDGTDPSVVLVLHPGEFAVLRLAFPFDSSTTAATTASSTGEDGVVSSKISFEPEALETLSSLEVPAYLLGPQSDVEEAMLVLDFAGKQQSGFHFPHSPAGSTTLSADVAAGAGAGRESKEVVTADADSVMTRCFSTFSFDEGGAAAPATSSTSTSSAALDPSFIISGYWPTLEGRIWQLYRPLPGGAYGSKEMDVDGGALATSSSSGGSGLGGW